MTDDPRNFAVNVVRKLQQAGFRALWAGGCVRDLLLGLAPADYDVATSATPEEVRSLFGHRRTLAVGASFGVIVVVGKSGEGQVEVATFRTEGPYRDGRRPDHVAFSTAEEDAQRRDFTINGLFLDPLTDEVFDYVGGRADLERRVLRAIGDPVERFREDKLRMLRGVRLAARFDYRLDPVTAAAIREHAADILVVSQERIAQELRKMLEHPRRHLAISTAREMGLLDRILPEVVGAAPLERLKSLIEPSFALSLAALLLGEPSAVEGTPQAAWGYGVPNSTTSAPARSATAACRRLKLSNDIVARVAWLVGELHAAGDLGYWPLARVKRTLIHEGATEFIDLLRSDAAARGVPADGAERLERLNRELTSDQLNPPPFLTGNELPALGIMPGPLAGKVLYELRDAQLNGAVATVSDAEQWVRDWIRQQ